MTPDVYLSLGTNLGDRQRNLRAALELLEPDVHVTTVSSLYETDPVGVPDQPAFLNLAARARTSLLPEELLHHVKAVEQRVGRVPTFRWGPRVVDIDIILYGDKSIHTEQLVIPHPEMTRRAFVLVPLVEIAPDVRHPVLAVTLREVRDALGSDQGVTVYSPKRSSAHGSPSMW